MKCLQKVLKIRGNAVDVLGKQDNKLNVRRNQIPYNLH